MLTLTDNAVQAIRSLTSQPDSQTDAGLRIMAGESDVAPLQLSLAPNPMAGDEVVETEGARVFMEPAAAEVLSDKALDAEVGEDGGVSFNVAYQPAEEA
jgi:iron-sulfur cluster assembly protein